MRSTNVGRDDLHGTELISKERQPSQAGTTLSGKITSRPLVDKESAQILGVKIVVGKVSAVPGRRLVGPS